MPRILEGKSGYYFVDSWDNVLTYRHVVSHEQAELYQGKGIATFVSLSNRLDELRRNNEVPNGFVQLGTEDDYENDVGIYQTVRWAKYGSYKWVEKSQEAA